MSDWLNRKIDAIKIDDRQTLSFCIMELRMLDIIKKYEDKNINRVDILLILQTKYIEYTDDDIGTFLRALSYLEQDKKITCIVFGNKAIIKIVPLN